MADFRYIDKPALTAKPTNVDMFPIWETGPNTLKKLSYETLKSFFVKTDENTDINADHEFQTGKKLSFGSSGEFSIKYETNKLQISTTSAKNVNFSLGGATFLEMYQANAALGIGSNSINRTGGAATGITFDASDNIRMQTLTTFLANVATGTKYFSYTGTNAGLRNDANNFWKAYNGFQVAGTGTVDPGLPTEKSVALYCDGLLYANGNILLEYNRLLPTYFATTGVRFRNAVPPWGGASITFFNCEIPAVFYGQVSAMNEKTYLKELEVDGGLGYFADGISVLKGSAAQALSINGNTTSTGGAAFSTYVTAGTYGTFSSYIKSLEFKITGNPYTPGAETNTSIIYTLVSTPGEIRVRLADGNLYKFNLTAL